MGIEYRITEEQLAKVLHDLAAPIANATAFNVELLESVQDLTDALESLVSDPSADAVAAVNEILDDDIKVCSDRIGSSITKLKAKVKTFTEQLNASAGEPSA
jgi:hypothetical protein